MCIAFEPPSFISFTLLFKQSTQTQKQTNSQTDGFVHTFDRLCTASISYSARIARINVENLVNKAYSLSTCDFGLNILNQYPFTNHMLPKIKLHPCNTQARAGHYVLKLNTHVPTNIYITFSCTNIFMLLFYLYLLDFCLFTINGWNYFICITIHEIRHLFYVKDVTIFWIGLPIKPFIWKMKPLHGKSS